MNQHCNKSTHSKAIIGIYYKEKYLFFVIIYDPILYYLKSCFTFNVAWEEHSINLLWLYTQFAKEKYTTSWQVPLVEQEMQFIRINKF